MTHVLRPRWVRRWDMWVHLWKRLKPHRCHPRNCWRSSQPVECRLCIIMKPKQAKGEILKVNQENMMRSWFAPVFEPVFLRVVMMAGVEPWSVAFQGVLSSWDAGSWTCCMPTNRKSSPCIINHALRFELCACYLALRCTQENHVNVNAKNLTFHDPFHIPSILRPRLCRDSTGENLATYFDHGRRPLW